MEQQKKIYQQGCEMIVSALVQARNLWLNSLRVQVWLCTILGSWLPDNNFPVNSLTLEGIWHATSPDTGFRGERKGCFKGTRVAVLDEIERWARFDKTSVFWLNGLAGTGKSAIAQTIAERLFAGGQLGASFFCSWDFEDRNNLRLIFPTIAYQLAHTYPEFCSRLISLVRSDPEVVRESLYNQMDRLIVQPLKESKISTVIVIDALDECQDEGSTSAILSVLGRLTPTIPEVKFFLTGRPEPRILNGLQLPLEKKVADVFTLHEVKKDLVANDIRHFFQHSFKEIGLDGWPAEPDLDTLCTRAGGLFVYAVATVKFLDYPGSTPQRRLNQLLQSPWSTEYEAAIKVKGNTTLDTLYMLILQAAYPESNSVDFKNVRSVLSAVILAANPLSTSAIATLLDISIDDVSPVLLVVQSLLIFNHHNTEHPVRPFHKSFPDFLVAKNRCSNVRFYIPPPYYHTEFLVNCLRLMNQRLRVNLCSLPNAVINSEDKTLGGKIKEWIDPALDYACKSWYKHLDTNLSTEQISTITSTVDQFLKEKFLFWLEALSLLGAVKAAVHALDTMIKWLKKVCPVLPPSDYLIFTQARHQLQKKPSPLLKTAFVL